MRQRPASRLLVINPEGRVLLFRYVHRSGPLAGDDYWGTPGGGVEDGETFEQAAIRELKEETGIVRNTVEEAIAEQSFTLQLPDGEYVTALERYFVVKVAAIDLSRTGWSTSEVEIIADHRWWSSDELMQTTATIWPEKLLDMLAATASRQ